MKLDEILQSAGKHKPRKRRGRGTGSGHGKTSCRGSNGAGSRAGWKSRLGKEGGQNSIFARIPKRGFSNATFRVTYQVVNVCDLERFDAESRIDAAVLLKAGLINDLGEPVKVLGKGELTKKLTVAVTQFSASAAEKIAKAGGATEKV